MIATVRTVLALAWVAAVTAVLLPALLVQTRTGLSDGAAIRRRWHGTVARALGLHVHVHGGLSAQRPLLVVSNHVSWTDITVIAAQFDASFVAKAEVAGWPVIGFFARLQRSVFVERERKRKSGDQANEIATRLARGDAVVLFAEGSTGDGNMMLPFKSTLFAAASMALAGNGLEAVHIQPLAIAYTRLHGLPMGRQHRPVASWIGDQDLAPHLRGVLAAGALDVELHFGEPVEFTAASDRKAVSREIESAVRFMMSHALAGRPQA